MTSGPAGSTARPDIFFGFEIKTGVATPSVLSPLARVPQTDGVSLRAPDRRSHDVTWPGLGPTGRVLPTGTPFPRSDSLARGGGRRLAGSRRAGGVFETEAPADRVAEQGLDHRVE